MNLDEALPWKQVLCLLVLFLSVAASNALCEEVGFVYSISGDKVRFNLPFYVFHSGNTVNELILPFNGERSGFSIDSNGRLKRGRVKVKVDALVVFSGRKSRLSLDYIVLKPKGAEAYFSLVLEPLYIDTRIKLKASLSSSLENLLLQPLSYPNFSSDSPSAEVSIDRLSFYLDDSSLKVKDMIGTVKTADKDFRIISGRVFLSSKGAGFLFELGPVGKAVYIRKSENKFVVLNDHNQEGWELLSERLVFDVSSSFSPGKVRPESLGFFAYRPAIRVRIGQKSRGLPYMWFWGQENWYRLSEAFVPERNFKGRLEKGYVFHLSSPKDLKILVYKGSYLEFYRDRGPLFDTAFMKSTVVFPSQFSSPSGRLAFDATGQLDAFLRGNIRVSFGRSVGLSLTFRDRQLYLRFDKLKLDLDLSEDYVVSVRQAELYLPYINDLKLRIRDFQILGKNGISFSLDEKLSGVNAGLYGLDIFPDRFVLEVEKGRLLSMNLSGLSTIDEVDLSDIKFFWTIYTPYQIALFPSDNLAVRNLSLSKDTNLYFRGGYIYGTEEQSHNFRLIFDVSLKWFASPVLLKGIEIELPVDGKSNAVKVPLSLPVRFFGMNGQLKDISFEFLPDGIMVGCNALFTPVRGSLYLPLDLAFSRVSNDGMDLGGKVSLSLNGFKMQGEIGSVDILSKTTLNLSGRARVFLFDSFAPIKANFSLEIRQNRIENFLVVWNSGDEFPFVSSLAIRNMKGKLWLDRNKSGPLMKMRVSADFSDVRGSLANFSGVIEARMCGDKGWGRFSVNGKMSLFPHTAFVVDDVDFSGGFYLTQTGVALALKAHIEKDPYNFWDLFYIKGGFDLSIEANNVDGMRCSLGSREAGFNASLFKGFPVQGYLDLGPDKDGIKGRFYLTSDISGPIYSGSGNGVWSYGIEPYRQLSCNADIYLSDSGHILCRYSTPIVFGASAYGIGFLALVKGDISLSSPNPWQFAVRLRLEKDLEWSDYALPFDFDLLDKEAR